MIEIDWEALEHDVMDINQRVPAIGMPYPTAVSCAAILGRLGCVKYHDAREDPVHVAAHRDYGVLALWSEDGGPAQLNKHLVQRCGPEGLMFMFGPTAVETFVLVEPREEPA